MAADAHYHHHHHHHHHYDGDGDTGCLPAKPIAGASARWWPRVATAGFLGLTYVRACSNHGLMGSSALAFPFFGTDDKERLFSMYMAGTLTTPLMIWTLEELGGRGHTYGGGWTEGHVVSLISPLLLGAAIHVRGIDRVAPLYYLDQVCAGALRAETPGTAARAVDPDIARAVLPATLLGHVVPSLLMGALRMTFTEVSRAPFTLQSIACHAFLYAPITVPLMTYGFAAAVRRRRRARTQKGDDTTSCSSPSSTAAVLREAYSDLVTVQAAGHLLTVASLAARAWALWDTTTRQGRRPPLPWAEDNKTPVWDWVQAPLSFVRFELLALYTAATTAMGLYTVWDLRRRGYTTGREARRAAVRFVAGHVVVGPGASYAALWRWREGVLAGLPPGV